MLYIWDCALCNAYIHILYQPHVGEPCCMHDGYIDYLVVIDSFETEEDLQQG